MFHDHRSTLSHAPAGRTAAILCALLLLLLLSVAGCESTPDSADEPQTQAARDQPEAATDDDATADKAADEGDGETDPLAAEFEAFAERVEQATEARSRPANEAAAGASGDIEWLESRPSESAPEASDAPSVDETAAAVPNVGQAISVEDVPDTPDDTADAEAGAADATDAEQTQPTVSGEQAMGTQELVATLSNRLAEEGRESLRPWLARAALSLADPRREMTDADLGTLPSEDRKLVLAYQRMFTQLGRSLGRDAEADREELELAAEELAEQLRAERHLSIRTAELCTRVDGYGVYEAFNSTTFVAGRERPAIVYIELDDFEAERTAEGGHEVRLRQEIVLYNASDGLAVWRVRPTDIVDESRNRRRDFFLVQVVKLPASLNVGKYLLKVTITDEVGEAVDEATIPIEFVADRNALARD